MNLTYNYHTIDETTYAFTDNGSGLALVLLHGFTGSSETWRNFIENWQTKYRVITVDLPGHGKTTGKSTLSMQEVCHHLLVLFDLLAIEKCHLLGYSMGGRTALSFAMWYPRYIEMLILESASPGLNTEQEKEARVLHDQQLASRLKDEGIEAFVDFWENIPLFATQKKLAKEVQAAIKEERLQQSAHGLANSLLYLGTGKQPSWWQDLDQLKRPVCLIVGELDEKFIHMNKKMQKKLPQASFHLVKNAGHTVHIEQPEAFSQIVEQHVL
ncbi:MAG TPA: 2-succinyl-6-hydroxy-2,4-cyclohexadiene-1-carboxylate synthase [Pseudogracilibacillus sp.]|nr:2-succinyl-6-hydroxy-2,4-cyclohexadiene-1-carboxylate synthase [Pseudogracilibacillus sp.]